MEFLIKAAQLMLSLSILVVLHEMGHFFPARWFGTRVEKFYLFFNPGFSLFKYKRGDTEYGIGWLPLGGYVKIAGMIDESFDTEQMQSEPQEWEFRSKPAWQRLIIMLGGVTVNFLLGFFIYAMILWTYGEEYLPNENIEYGIYVDSLGNELGLRNGDHLLKVGEKPLKNFNPGVLIQELTLEGARTITVRRDGEEVDIKVKDEVARSLSGYKNQNSLIFDARVPFVASGLVKDSPAEKVGVEVGDQIIAFNDTPTPYFNDFQAQAQQNKGEDITITAVRNETDTMNFDMTTTENGTVGIYRYDKTYFFDTERIDYTFLEALPAGVMKGWDILALNVKALGKILTGKLSASENLGGFGSIGKMFDPVWNWEKFWFMTAALSLILAFMNLLPIPALDGGHVMFLLYEVVSGRKPSDKFMEIATMVGFVIVLSLVVYANGLDLWRWITG
jgi:regulator of sigma E protease